MADLHTTLVHFDIVYDEPVVLSEWVQRITANNPSAFTGPGTNTYVIGKERFVVVDPGPNDPAHVEAILKATDGKIDYILATHAHEDHSPAGKPLADATGAAMIGFRCDVDSEHLDKTFVPKQDIEDGEVIDAGDFQLRAIYTPGHLKQHVCYLLEQESTLFAGDHIMQGATVVIIPPHGGTMWEYLESLMKLKGQGINWLAPAQGDIFAYAEREVE